MDEKTLQHYGILGMKWGVRRTEAQLAKARGKVEELEKKLEGKNKGKKASSDSPESQPKKRTIKDLSDEELRARINRINMEKQYADLMKGESKKKTSAGKAFVSEVLKNSGKNVATQFVTFAMGTAVNKAFKDVFNDDAIINPKKGQKDK